MKYLLITILLITATIESRCQETLISNADTAIYTTVDSLPYFLGNDTLMQKFIQDNFRYPERKSRDGNYVDKSVNFNFIVTSEGKIVNVQNTEIIKGTDQTVNEIIRIIKLMPEWTPGYLYGRKVNTKVYYNISMTYNQQLVIFRLTNISLHNQKKTVANKYYLSGLEKIKQKDYESALHEFTCCLAIFPKDIDALYNRAAISKKLGNMDEACNDWKKIKLLGSPDADEFISKYCKN